MIPISSNKISFRPYNTVDPVWSLAKEKGKEINDFMLGYQKNNAK